MSEPRTHYHLQEVAELAGIAESTIRSYMTRGQMPKPGRCPCCRSGNVWAKADIDQWLAGRAKRKGEA